MLILLSILLLISITGYLFAYIERLRIKKERDKLGEIVQIAENSKDIVYYLQIKPKYKFKYLSPSIASIVGEKMGNSLKENPKYIKQLVHPEDSKIVIEKVFGLIDYDQPILFRCKNEEGQYSWVEELTTPIYHDGELVAIQGIIRNVDEKVKQYQDIKYRLFHDSLTGIYNREYFDEKMRIYNNRIDASIGIIICDLDKFKIVNDCCGHHIGDNLLKECAKLLNQFANKDIIVARIGGDEFALMLKNTTIEQIEHLITQVRNELEVYNNESKGLKLEMSLGYSFIKSSINRMHGLFMNADANMYSEKNKKKENQGYRILIANKDC